MIIILLVVVVGLIAWGYMDKKSGAKPPEPDGAAFRAWVVNHIVNGDD